MTDLPTLSPGYNWRADELEWPVTTDVGRGLSGVVATVTEVMWLDPASGTLSYRGRPVEALAGERGFEEVAFLLIAGALPEEAPDAFAGFRGGLRSSREMPGEVLALLADLDPHTHPTLLLRACASALGCHELSVTDDLSGESHWRDLRILGQVAGLVGAIAGHRAGLSPGGPPDISTSLAHGLLTALTDREPEPEDVRTLDLLWVLYAAHGLDAPTFASMVVASCLADPYFNVVAGLSALRGPRQGGTTEAVLEQLGRLERPEDAARFVGEILDIGGTVAGFGHRAYRMPDPRVVVLRRELAALVRRRGRDELFARARALETAATAALAGRGVHVNINFYAAPIFALLGADPAMVPCLYAVARTAGILALVREAMETIRLVRPLTRYVGAAERRVSSGGLR